MLHVQPSASAGPLVQSTAAALGATPQQGVALAAYVEEREWYRSAADLREAIADGGAWAALRLPGRLKLALKAQLAARRTQPGGRAEADDAAPPIKL